MKKTILAMLLVMTLCLSFLVACDSGSKSESSKPAEGSEASSEHESSPGSGEGSETAGGSETAPGSESEDSSESDEEQSEIGGGETLEKQYVRDGNYIYFGEYPQTLKSSDVTITKTVDERGYYLGSDGAYYAKVLSTPCVAGYKFSNGNEVKESTDFIKTHYYFKVEPIRWRIISEDEDSALVICDGIIANGSYDDYDSSYSISNSYADSDIRAWLNNEFYNTAFSELAKQVIMTVTLDNSASSTGFDTNDFACGDTEDKVFLLSYADVTNPEYGFSADPDEKDYARLMITSDYARATGVSISTDYESGYGTGDWWLRSPANGYHTYVRDITKRGECATLFFYDCNNVAMGIVPALRIKL